MKRDFKFGFTLAEVLLALMIAGVIASLTVPQLVSDTQNRKRAAALGRAVEKIETGCQTLVQDMSEKSEDGVFSGYYTIHKSLNGSAISSDSDSIAANDFLVTAKKYFNVVPLSSTQISDYVSSVVGYDGGTASPEVNEITGSTIVRDQNTGAYYDFQNGIVSDNADDPVLGVVYVDVNGATPPNKYGLDVFVFGLTDSCHMIPAGTNRMNNLYNDIPSESDGCSGVGSSVTNGLSCTSRVVREGYKINYKK